MYINWDNAYDCGRGLKVVDTVDLQANGRVDDLFWSGGMQHGRGSAVSGGVSV